MRQVNNNKQITLTFLSLFGVFIVVVSSAILPYYATVAGENVSQTINNIKEHFLMYSEKEYLLFFDYFLIPFTISFLSIIFALMILLSEKFKDKYRSLLKIIFILMVFSIAYLYFSRSIVHLFISIGFIIVIINYIGIRILNHNTLGKNQ